jgi:hypothetical protein
MVAAAVGVDDEAMFRVKTLKRGFSRASLVLEVNEADMMEWGPFV